MATLTILETEDVDMQSDMLSCLDLEVVRITTTAYGDILNHRSDVCPGVHRNGGRNRVCD